MVMMGLMRVSQQRCRSARRLSEDGTAQASFAMIAVAILIASSAAGVLVMTRELEERDRARQEETLARMGDIISDVAREIELVGVARAHGLVSSWDEYPVNDSLLSRSFHERVGEYVRSAFPRTSSGTDIQLANWTGSLFLIEMTTYDVAPSDESEPDEFTADGSSMDYARFSSPSDDLIGERTATPYYAAVGNFTVRASTGSAALSKECSFEEPIVSALPLLKSKLKAFDSSSAEEPSDLGRTVNHMLSTLVQLRVLEGCGVPSCSGALPTCEILTEQDVYEAVAVGLLIEQARTFRALDASFAREVAALFDGGEPGLSALLGSSGRTLDPAELFLWFLGKTELELDVDVLVAQAIFGISDQLSLRIMDYLGWLGVLDDAGDFLSDVYETLQSVVARLTGEDEARAAVLEWLRRSIESTGSEPEDVSLLFAPEDELSIWVPDKVYYVEDAAGNTYPVCVGNVTVRADIPSFDLLDSDMWVDFYPAYKECQASFSGLLSDALRRFAFDLASCADVDLGGTGIDPRDGTELFSELMLGSVDVVLDPERIAEAARELPFFSAHSELLLRLRGFVDERGVGSDERAEALDGMYSSLAEEVLSTARYEYIPNIGVSVEEQLSAIVRTDLESDLDWGVCDLAERLFDGMSEGFLERFVGCVDSSVSKVDDTFAGPLVDSLASALVFGAGLMPGVEEMVEDCLRALVDVLISQNRLSAGKRSAYVDLAHPFEFWQGDKAVAYATSEVLTEPLSVEVMGGLPPLEPVPYDPAAGYDSLRGLVPVDSLLVQVRDPWEFDGSQDCYPNTHLTALGDISATPYSTQWTVSVIGLLDMIVTTNGSTLQSVFGDGDASASHPVKIELSFPVVAHSAWPLDGVEYNPSNTLLSDAVQAGKKFCELVWDKLEPVFGWVKDGVERMYGFVERVFETAASFSTRMVKVLAVTMQGLVETLQEYVQEIADSALAKAVDLFVDLLGTVEVRVSLYGFVVIVRTNLPDLLFRGSVDKLRIMVYTDRFGPGITVGVRVAKFEDGRYDVVANGTIATDDARMDVVVDPLMLVNRRFVEMHCQARTWALDLVIPEVEPYELAEVSTADVPGVGALLSNVPIPVLGLSASVEAGIRLKYSLPFPTDLVVNEFESNPQGEDGGNEWAEIFNPLDKPKTIDGWTLSTQHGKVCTMTLQGVVPAGGLLLVRFPETSLDNGVPGDPFNDGDGLVLTDPSGTVVDCTPVLSDTANDARTLQRSWDGGPRWVLRTGTPGSSNGPALLMASSDFIVKCLFEAFREAFAETTLSEVSASLDFLSLFAKRVLHNFIENLLSIVKDIIHEVVFFIEVTLSDAAGVASGGFRISFAVSGESVVELLRWLIFSMATFVVNLGRANTPVAYPSVPPAFFESMFIRFELLLEVGLPKMMRVIGAVGDLEARYALAVAVFPNLPAIGKLAGKSWGAWSVGFGAYLEGVPREFVAKFLSKTSGDFVDFWIFKARLRGI